jgi:SAM-dependent methyltransferase
MDDTNYNIMLGFRRRYLSRKRNLQILDVGSYDVNGTFREIFIGHNYIGADIIPGLNVDIILDQPYNWQFANDSFDVVISGSTIEHMEYPWEWFKEVHRILKPGGFICIIAPAVIHQHRYPIDTYRYYPDGMRALARWGNLTPIKVKRKKSFSGKEEYTYMVAIK